MRTFDRVLPHVLAAKADVENRQKQHQRKCSIGVIECQIGIAVIYLNDALTRMEKR